MRLLHQRAQSATTPVAVLIVTLILAATGIACGGGSPSTEPVEQAATPTASATAPPTTTATPTTWLEPAITATPSVTRYGYRVVNTYPHDPSAFTQGLVYEDGVLYEGTGLYGRSSLRKVELETGEVLESQPLPDDYFGEGITIFGDRIYQITWRSETAFVYDRETFDLLDAFSYDTEGWGITHDSQRLIMSDGTSTLYFRDPETFAEIGTVEVHDEDGPVDMLNELEYIDGEVWANVWMTDTIVRIDPTTGRVTGMIDLSGLLDPETRRAADDDDVLNGIAWDSENERLFVTGKRWPVLFEIELVPES